MRPVYVPGVPVSDRPNLREVPVSIDGDIFCIECDAQFPHQCSHPKPEPTPTPEGLPETIRSTGADGHAYIYRVIGTYPDGSLRTSSWDAEHDDDNCACGNPEEWY